MRLQIRQTCSSCSFFLSKQSNPDPNPLKQHADVLNKLKSSNLVIDKYFLLSSFIISKLVMISQFCCAHAWYRIGVALNKSSDQRKT